MTRRAMLAALPLGLTASVNTSKKARTLPRVGEFFRFLDPTTETPVVRLTNLSSNSFLPAATNRFVSVKDRFLVFSSDRMGKPTPFHLDLHTGILAMLAPTSELDPASLCLEERQRFLYLLDGGALKEIALANKRTRVVADGVSAFSMTGAAVFVVKQGRLEVLNAAEPLAENVSAWCLVRPGGAGCVFARNLAAAEREYWYVERSGAIVKGPVLLARGPISNPFWSPDGRSLLFLRDVPGPQAVFSEIHEVLPEIREERRVDKTSQFAAFAPNSDASVFVGASRSKAQPTLILLLRSTQRELTLCEHRASHPASVSPVFAPDSRRVYFQSDHEGKSALYSVNVELLVEPTLATA